MEGSSQHKPDLIQSFLQRRCFKLAIGAGIVTFSVAFLGYFLYKNWGTITAYHWRVDYAALGLTALLHLCAFATGIYGWHAIISRLVGVDDLALNARIYSFSVVARRIPGMAWEIATRVVMYGELGVSKAIVGLGSLLEILVTTLAGSVMYIALTPFTASYASRLGSWPLLAALGLGIILTHPRLVTYVMRKVRRNALPVPLRYADTLRWFWIYVVDWIIGGLVLFATVRTIYPLPYSNLLQVIADWTLTGVLTSFITFVPSSLGLREVTFTLLLSRYMPEHVAIVAAILVRLLMTAYSLLWLLVATRLGKAREKSPHA
jgi:hypothetical protein